MQCARWQISPPLNVSFGADSQTSLRALATERLQDHPAMHCSSHAPYLPPVVILEAAAMQLASCSVLKHTLGLAPAAMHSRSYATSAPEDRCTTCSTAAAPNSSSSCGGQHGTAARLQDSAAPYTTATAVCYIRGTNQRASATNTGHCWQKRAALGWHAALC